MKNVGIDAKICIKTGCKHRDYIYPSRRMVNGRSLCEIYRVRDGNFQYGGRSEGDNIPKDCPNKVIMVLLGETKLSR